MKKIIIISLVISFSPIVSVAASSGCIGDSSLIKTGNGAGWNRGIVLLDSGRVLDGLKLADSMLENDVYGFELQAMFEYTLLKLFLHTEKRSENTLFEKNAIFKNDSLDLSAFNCRMSGSGGKGEMLPDFQYNFIFPVDKPYHLIFNGLIAIEPPHLILQGKDQYAPLNDELLHQMMFRKDSISCSIYLDFNKQIVSLHDYISQFVQGVYDSIDYKKDLEKYHTFSLRGYRQAWDKQNGRFTAIVIFDRLFQERQKGKKSVQLLPVRITVIVKSTISVCEFAELKLQKLLKML